MTALYELPTPTFAGPASKLLLGGWEIGTVTILQSGPPSMWCTEAVRRRRGL